MATTFPRQSRESLKERVLLAKGRINRMISPGTTSRQNKGWDFWIKNRERPGGGRSHLFTPERDRREGNYDFKSSLS